MDNNDKPAHTQLPMKKFKNDHFLGHFCNLNYEHIFQLDDKVAKRLHQGENLTEELFEFFILEFLSSNPLIKSKKGKSNYVIITEKFLHNNFKKPRDLNDENIQHLKVYILL